MKQRVLIVEAYHSYQLLAIFYLAPFCQDKLHMQRKLLGLIRCGFCCKNLITCHIYFALSNPFNDASEFPLKYVKTSVTWYQVN